MKTIVLKKRLVLFLLLGSVVSSSFAQTQRTWDWAKNIVGTNNNFPYAITADKMGNSYVAGGFTDTLKVGNNVLISKGSYDMYLLKYNSSGEVLWGKQAGGTDADEVYAISTDNIGNVYLTGYFSGTANFSALQLKSAGNRDFFVAKYNSNGEMLWVKQGGSNLEDFGTAITIDKNNNVLVTGIFHGNLYMEDQKYISKGGKDIFLAKYSSDGQLLWSRVGGGLLEDVSTSLTTDNNSNIYLTGYFSGTIFFDKKESLSAGKEDVFIAKFDENGNIQWLKREGSATGNDHATAIAADNSGNVYLTGYFSGLADFGKFELKNMSSDDVFIAKYNSNGETQWAKQSGGSGNEHANGMTLDKNGNIYITGEYNVSFSFGENNIKTIGDWDIFILKFNNSGDMLGGTQIGGTGYDKAFGISVDAASNLYIGGYFTKALTIGNTNFSSIDENDGFVAKLKGF